jgi:hypothetical protein
MGADHCGCSFQPTSLNDYCEVHRPVPDICRFCGVTMTSRPIYEHTLCCDKPECQLRAVRRGKRRKKRYFKGRQR